MKDLTHPFGALNADGASPEHVLENTISLASGGNLRIRGTNDASEVQITHAGQLVAVIESDERGLRVRLSAPDLTLEANGALTLRADTLNLQSLSGTSLTSDGDLVSTAREHRLTSERGDVALTANDDIRLAGERIRNNC